MWKDKVPYKTRNEYSTKESFNDVMINGKTFIMSSFD